MTGIYQPLNQSLEKANRHHHENATCPKCRVGEQYVGTEWVKRGEFSRLDHFGWPLAFDAETGDVLFLSNYCHNLTIGSTGTGKTEVYIKNAIRLMAELPDKLKPSFLITDQKGDLGEEMIPVLQQNGYTTFAMNMKSPYFSCHYNFLLPLYDRYMEAHRLKCDLEEERIGKVLYGVEYGSEDEARQMAYCISQDNLDFVERSIAELSHIIIPSNKPQDETWYAGARNVLEAAIWGLLYDALEPELTGITRERFTLATLLSVTRHTDEDCEELIEWLKNVPDNACVKSAISGVLDIRAKVTRDGYISTLQSAVAVFNAAAIGAITSTENSLDLHEIVKGEKPFAVVLITDDRQKATNNVAALFLNNFLNEAMEEADRRSTHALSRDLVIMADEFANMPALPDLDKRITTLRSRRVWLMMAIQSIQQLDKVYTPDVSGIVQDNCDLNLFLGCNNDDTKERFSRSMGSHLGVKTSYSIYNDGAMSVQKGSENVPLVKKSDLDALQLGELYVRARRAQNLQTCITPYFIWAKGGPRADLRGGHFFAYDAAAHFYDVNTRKETEKRLRREQARKEAEERKKKGENAGNSFFSNHTEDESPLARRFRTLRNQSKEGQISDFDDFDEDAEVGRDSFLSKVMDGLIIGRATSDDSVSLLPRDGEKLLAQHGVRIEARKEGGWSIYADISGLKYTVEKDTASEQYSPRKWYEYKVDGKTFRANCSDSMRGFVLAKLYGILQGPRGCSREKLSKVGADHLACVFRAALDGNAQMQRTEMLEKLRNMARLLENGEDWYILAAVHQTIEAVEQMSDALFDVVKNRILK